MYSAHGSIWATVVFAIVSAFSCASASSQTVKLTGHATDPLLLTHWQSYSNPCAEEVESAFTELPAEAAVAGGAPSFCDSPPAAAPVVKPCDPASRIGTGCDAPKDLVQAELNAMGKAGQKISRAREKVLEILQTENACTAWFQQKDANPAATFRTLSFVLDRHGEEFILESRDLGPLNIFRHPYVAKVTQGDGAYGTITLNPKGAFFSSMGRVLEVRKEGGPSSLRGTRLMRVGPHAGDTLPAQVIALLHEFGHVLDLLPVDQDNVDGKSVQNTHEVLRFCSAEVESRLQRNALGTPR